MNNRRYLDIHVLQTVPPSCVNRDDTGSPKTAVYGGVTRARVSSQAWKRAMREEFAKLVGSEQCGIRTERLDEVLGERIAVLNPSVDAAKLAESIVKQAEKEKLYKKKTLVFVSYPQLDALAELAIRGKATKDELKEAFQQQQAIDIALFGRMVAVEADLNCDAAAQVAHSISTHAVRNEFDFFTAMDDQQKSKTEAAYMGTKEFNSSTLYRYATVNLNELEHSFEGDTAHMARCFVDAFIHSMPTGMQNGYANRTLPDLIYVTLREDQPVNLCGAFEKPIRANGAGYVEPSVSKLADYAQKLYSTFAAPPQQAFVVCMDSAFAELAQTVSIAQLLEAVEQAVSEKE